jgi:hypothetical protein
MVYHILNGDALIDRFLSSGISGEKIVARECLIEGSLEGDTLPDFWKIRAAFIFEQYADEALYFQNVVSEFDKLLSAPEGSEFNLWFGYDLFCRANMWFVIHLIQSLAVRKKVFLVYPSFLASADIWHDFGTAGTDELKIAFKNRVLCSENDLKLGDDLWDAYKKHDLTKLEALSKSNSPAFPYLEEVCRAHIDRFPPGGKGRPERVLQDIISHSATDFYSVFEEFSKREGVYGFGDLQVKRIYDQLI